MCTMQSLDQSSFFQMCGDQFFPGPFVDKMIFFHWAASPPLSEVSCPDICVFISGLVIISIISSVLRTVFLLPFQLDAFCLSYLIHWPELQCLIEMMRVDFFAFFLILGENMQFFTIKYHVSYTIVFRFLSS